MKCPKCSYLGFESGERCKHCGYDFSLASAGTFPPDAGDAKISRAETGGPDIGSLPLFLTETGDDTPLITVPSKPRAPLAVRRTPDASRLRVTPQPRPAEPALDFREEPAEEALAQTRDPHVAVERAASERVAGRRVAAAAIDHALLLAVDATVIYFTMRIAGVGAAELDLLPPIPLGLFLVLMKVAYFTAFTAVGGQTIGKMATGVRVVADDFGSVSPHGAVRRTLAAILAHVTFGLGYLPALIGPDRRAVHDRLAHTRVVAPPSA